MIKGEASDLEWLISWRNSLCDGAFEHESGIEIVTLDNPGWGVIIDLKGTALENRSMQPLAIDGGDNDWIFCKIVDNEFHGHGDNFKLFHIIKVFRNLVANEAS